MERRKEQFQLVGSQIFSNKYVHMRDKMNPFAGNNIDPSAALINEDSKLLAQYSNLNFQHNVILKNYTNVMKSAKTSAVDLIELITKEYHFE
jgi:hypothetical protein